jgi:crotonobetainyl-CoA:carnitine CoA-transferase CaiB-like acyl-CoA transferase
MTAPEQPGGPLEGVRVLDLTQMLAGPFTTMLLADLGADVVKIEPPGGDTTRAVGPFRAGDDPRAALGGYFQSVNRGERSVVLDLKSDAIVARLLELVAVADVVVENFSAGVMERLRVPYERLAEVNPRLVYGALRGFGDHRTGASPYETWPALDVVAQAMGGFLGITGTADGTPVKSGPGVGDIFPGALLALGIVAAVRHAELTGEGQFVDVAMYDAILSLCERLVYQHSYLGQIPRPVGNTHPLLSPFDILPTRDGWVAIAAPADHHWVALTKAMGRPELADDERYRTNLTRVARREEVRDLLAGWLAGLDTADVVARLGGTVPVGPVNDAAAIAADPHVTAREMLALVEQPGSERPVTVAGSAIKLTRTPARVRGRGPRLGEDEAAAVLDAWSAR